MKIPTPLTPYIIWFKIGFVAIVLTMSFTGGCQWQKGRDAKKLADKDIALSKAAASLSFAATALREQNAAAKLAQDNEKLAINIAAKAGEVLDTFQSDQTKAAKDFDRRLKEARKNAACDAIMNIDVVKECGL